MARGRPQKTSRDQWLEAAVALLAEGGVDAIRIEAMARHLGVTKGGFYGHFADRADLLEAVLGLWEQAGTDAIIEAADVVQGDPILRGERLWQLATEDGIEAELGIRSWARHDERARAVVERVDHRRMEYLRGLFRERGFAGIEAEARCLLIYSLLVGDHFIEAKHGRLSRRRVLAHCRALLMRDPD